jgi:hypothetical protein
MSAVIFYRNFITEGPSNGAVPRFQPTEIAQLKPTIMRAVGLCGLTIPSRAQWLARIRPASRPLLAPFEPVRLSKPRRRGRWRGCSFSRPPLRPTSTCCRNRSNRKRKSPTGGGPWARWTVTARKRYGRGRPHRRPVLRRSGRPSGWGGSPRVETTWFPFRRRADSFALVDDPDRRRPLTGAEQLDLAIIARAHRRLVLDAPTTVLSFLLGAERAGGPVGLVLLSHADSALRRTPVQPPANGRQERQRKQWMAAHQVRDQTDFEPANKLVFGGGFVWHQAQVTGGVAKLRSMAQLGIKFAVSPCRPRTTLPTAVRTVGFHELNHPSH